MQSDEEDSHLDVEIMTLATLAPRGVRPWCGRVVQAIRHVGGQVVFTFAIFFLILFRHYIAKFFGGQPITGEFWPSQFWEHLAVAFAVSGIVIFGWEWGSEVKHTLDISAKLANALHRHIDQILQASSRDAIANAMRQLVGRRGDVFTAQLKSFAESVGSLSNDDWASKGYLHFIEWFHKEFTRYAASLAHLSVSQTEFRLVLREATDPIDVMLAGMTQAMGGCGTYYAISDVFTWTKLRDFHREQKEALVDGLQIKRIFIMGKKSDEGVLPSEVSARMHSHFDEAEESHGKYRIKLISDDDFRVLAPPILMKTEHFGIFKPTETDKQPLIVQVLDAQLLSFRIAGATEAESVLAAFEELWDNEDLPEVTDPNKACDIEETAGTPDYVAHVEDEPPSVATAARSEGQPEARLEKSKAPTISGRKLIRDHLMAYRLRQLPAPVEVSYHGASKIETWTEGALQQFEQGIVEAVGRGVAVQRLFVFDGKANIGEAQLQTLLRHAEIAFGARKEGRDNYQWRVVLKSEFPEIIRGYIPFALFRDGKSSGDVDFEVAQGDNFRFGATRALASQLDQGFKDVWKKVEDFKKSMDCVFDNLSSEANRIIELMTTSSPPPNNK